MGKTRGGVPKAMMQDRVVSQNHSIFLIFFFITMFLPTNKSAHDIKHENTKLSSLLSCKQGFGLLYFDIFVIAKFLYTTKVLIA